MALAVKPITLEKGVLLTVNGSADEITDGDNKNLVWRFQTNGRAGARPSARRWPRTASRPPRSSCCRRPLRRAPFSRSARASRIAGGKVPDEVSFNAGQPSYRVEVSASSPRSRTPSVASVLPISTSLRCCHRQGALCASGLRQQDPCVWQSPRGAATARQFARRMSAPKSLKACIAPSRCPLANLRL